MGISTFGGAPADSGAGVTDPMVVGQVVQAAGGVNMLPADGRILNRDDYPIAYGALQDISIEGTTLTTNSMYSNMDTSLSAIPGAAISSKSTLIYLSSSAAGTLNVSQDHGQTWQIVALPVDPNTSATLPWKFLAANDSIFCAISDRYSAISGDGLNWTLGNALPVTLDVGVMTWTGTKFAWFGSNALGGNVYITSTDGLSWSNANGIPLGMVHKIFQLSSGSYFAYGNTDSKGAATNKVAISTDGVNWTSILLPSSETFLTGAYNKGTNTICLVAGNKFLTSNDDGNSWTSTLFSTIPGAPFTTITSAASMVATDSTFILPVVSSTGTYKYGTFKSTDGINWTLVASYGNLTYANNIVMPMMATDNAGTIVVVSQGITSVSKDEGVTWIAVQPSVDNGAPNAVIWTGSQFVCFNNTSPNSYKSTDGINWTLASSSVPLLPGQASLYTYNASLGVHFLTSGAINSVTCGVCLTSPDGITWTSRALPATVQLHSITSSGSKTIITNNTGANVYLTTNGTSFAAQAATGTGSWIAAGSPTQFVRIPLPTGALTSGSTYYTSPDAVTWTSRTLPIPTGMPAGFTGWSPSAVFWTGSQFVIISGSSASSTIYCAIATSTDGINWTFVNQPFGTTGFQGVSYNGIAYAHYPVAYGSGGMAVLLRSYSGSEINLAITSNGNSWNPLRMLPRGSGYVFAGESIYGGGDEVFAVSGPYVIRYRDSTGQVDVSMLSTAYNGRTGANLKVSGSYYSFAFTQAGPNNVFSYPHLHSNDFSNWSLIGVTASNIQQPAYSNGKITAVNIAGNFVTSSDGGLTWTSSRISYAGTNHTTKNICAAGDKLFMCYQPTTTANAALAYTYPMQYDGSISMVAKIPFFSLTLNGTSNPFARKMARNGNKVVMGHALDAAVSTSADGGDSWLSSYSVSGVAPCSFAYHAHADIFVMVPYNATASSGLNNAAAHTIAYTSKDGYKWTLRVMPSSQKWAGVRSFGNLIVAVAGVSSVWAYSFDGINWTQVTAPATADWMFMTGTDKCLMITTPAASTTYAQVTRFYDPATQFQLPVYTAVAAGQPGWFIKVK